MSNLTLLTVTACTAVLCLCLFIQSFIKAPSRRLPFPPGPTTDWFGRVKLPSTNPWLTYAKWRDLYGDVIYIYVYGNPILVLNSAEAVRDLLENRSHNYSSRPIRTMIVKLMGWDWLFSTMPYGPWWKKHRTLFHQHFQTKMIPAYRPILLKETHTTLRNFLHSPDNYYYHIRRDTAAIVLQIAYGHQVADAGDPLVAIADEALRGLGEAGIFGTYLVDYFPFLRHIPAWVPGAAFKRKANAWRKATRKMVDMPFSVIKQQIAQGTAVPCFATAEMEIRSQLAMGPEDEELVKNVAAIAYAGGADTSVSVLISFISSMVINPEVQQRAQDDLDRVVGMDRLPLFADRESLPYIDCIVWECLRLNPVTPLSLPRTVTRDDEYRGFRIPKGTTVMPNVWAILHDERSYPDAHLFKPERFADPEKNALAGLNDIPDAAFGFGRRICPGRWVAFEMIWIAAASLLSVYNFRKALDENGMPIEPVIEYTSSMLSRPKPFKCRIVPRHEAAVILIKETVDVS